MVNFDVREIGAVLVSRRDYDIVILVERKVCGFSANYPLWVKKMFSRVLAVAGMTFKKIVLGNDEYL